MCFIKHLGMTTGYFSLLLAATKLGQGNVFTGICDSVHGGCLPQEQTPLPEQTPPNQTPRPDTPLGPDTPGADNPPGLSTPPTPGSRLQDTVNEQLVRILLQCILVFKVWFPSCFEYKSANLICKLNVSFAQKINFLNHASN